MEITKEFLKEKCACAKGYEWFIKQKETDGIKVVKKLIKEDKHDWANWIIVRIMSYKQYVSYAVFSAEQVIDIYKKKYPNDQRPRKAINSAKECIKNPSVENKKLAAYAAYAAYAYAAYASSDAAYAYAAYAARKEMRIKILNYGIKLLKSDSQKGGINYNPTRNFGGVK